MMILSALATGLIAGCAHVFAGPDHLAAVAPLAMDQRRNPVAAGLFWGIGHSSGVWVLALIALLLRDILPLDWFSSWSERIVGVVLIGVGLWAIRKAVSMRIHTHVHEHDGVTHAHVHVHQSGLSQHDELDHSHNHKALGIGLLHGFAGTSHLLGVLPALMLPTRLGAVMYVLAFGIGSVCGMSAFTWIVGRMANHLGGSNGRASQCLFIGSGVAAIAIGCFWLTT